MALTEVSPNHRAMIDSEKGASVTRNDLGGFSKKEVP